MFTTIISINDLRTNLNDPDWLVIDCRFSLNDTERGKRDYRLSHIPGAIYAHLDADLSAPIIPGKTGRHPLPSPEKFAEKLSEWGVDKTVQVVAYDDAGGGVASRLWWMLRWLGHDAVAVLDGGWNAWIAANFPVSGETTVRSKRNFVPNIRENWVVDADWITAASNDSHHCVMDARAASRFTGEQETIDPVAGHIPGALNVPFAENLDENGFFLSPEMLRQKYESILGERSAEKTATYCGSGVTACHNLLAMKHAGFPDALLYPGSWSEWITDKSRAIATGEN
ncbi:MAG: sulfurtransferase [Calditrichaeota bacterium]|nr:sulfurtransferase [Calditrichota bacterium]MCB0268149.1 sulfurtransferase [Calditrichota bacterium]